MTEQQKEEVKNCEAQAESKGGAVFIDLGAFMKDIQTGDSEWFERIATRELQKLKTTRTTRG
jgi:hypothetical protein